MSVTRAWVGGHDDNNIIAGSNWTPTGSPQPGDMLVMRTGTANMIGGNLAGDALFLGDAPFSGATQTLNLFKNATIEKLEVGFNSATVNSYGHDTIETLQTDLGIGNFVTFNIESHSTLRMTIADPPTPEGVHVTGLSRSSLLINDGPSFVQSAVIDVTVRGHGSWTPSGFFPGVTFDKGVGSGQSVDMHTSGSLRINDPEDFKGLVNLKQTFWGSASLSDIHGDFFTYHDDTLKIMSNGKTVATLRVHETSGAAFSIANSASGITLNPTFMPQASHGYIT